MRLHNADITVEGKKDVVHTARIEVDKLTVEALEAARTRAKAPVDAEFNVIKDRPSNQITFGTTPSMVEFRWVDRV